MANIICLFKASFIIFNLEGIWNLLNVTRIRFLSSRQCAKYTLLLHEYRKFSINLTKTICVFILLIAILWICSPLAINLIMFRSEVINKPYMNVINIPFPVNLHTYNEFFFLFYVIEIITSLSNFYITTLFDILFISLSYAFIAQYHVLFEAYKNVNIHNQTSEEGMTIKISILHYTHFYILI